MVYCMSLSATVKRLKAEIKHARGRMASARDKADMKNEFLANARIVRSLRTLLRQLKEYR